MKFLHARNTFPLVVSAGSVSAGKLVCVDRKAKSETTLDAIDPSLRDLSIRTTPGVKIAKGICTDRRIRLTVSPGLVEYQTPF